MKRHDPLPALILDRTAHEPLYRQLATALRLAIRTGHLPPGAALPSTRGLAEALGVSRNTVLTAYEELTAEGLLGGRAGSATRVCGQVRPPIVPDWRAILRAAQYPAGALTFRDPDGNTLSFHR